MVFANIMESINYADNLQFSLHFTTRIMHDGGGVQESHFLTK